MSQSKQDFERRLSEKEEEIDNTRRNGQRALESMQTSLDSESKSRAEAIRQKKKLQGAFNDNLAKYDEAERRNEDIGEQMAVIERRSNLLTGEIEELRNAVEQAERGRKLAETELNESNE